MGSLTALMKLIEAAPTGERQHRAALQSLTGEKENPSEA
jgi:hypothetical protein